MFVEVLQNILNPTSLLLILAGVVLGNVFGAIPGLNTPIAIALVLPITMIMDPVPSVCLLMGIYMGGVSGGLVAAILLKIPGTAAAVATVFDGYPMAQKGEGTRAVDPCAASFKDCAYLWPLGIFWGKYFSTVVGHCSGKGQYGQGLYFTGDRSSGVLCGTKSYRRRGVPLCIRERSSEEWICSGGSGYRRFCSAGDRQ